MRLKQLIFTIYLIFSKLVVSLLEVVDALLLYVFVFILILKCLDERPKLVLFLLDVNIVSLKILVFLTTKYFTEILV